MLEVLPSRMSSWLGLARAGLAWEACSWLRMGLMELAINGARLEPAAANGPLPAAAAAAAGAPCWKKPGSGTVEKDS